jgi:hypothetical protein
MPFVVRVKSWKGTATALEATGTLVSGAFYGAEAVRLTTRHGAIISGVVVGHEMKKPAGWPIRPEHVKTTLILAIRAYQGVSPRDLAPEVVGLGCIGHNPDRVDLSAELSSPLLWATQLHETLVDDGESLVGEIFTVEKDELDGYYERHITAHHDAGRWPYLRVPLSRGRALEVEHADLPDFQVRYWIHDAGGARVLLGYESGHFSLPGVRLDELVAVVRDQPDRAARTGLLLMLPCLYLYGGESIAVLADVIATLPGLRPGGADRLVATFDENCGSGHGTWARDPALGWIHRGRYSQRDPGSALSILGPEDHAAIASFFGV